MAQIFLSLGSNIENRYKFIKLSIDEIQHKLGNVIKMSEIFETQSWSYNDNPYLNCVIEIESSLSPLDLLTECQNIELLLGRNSKTVLKNGKPQYSARIIDVDILFYENEIINTPELTIPHPLLHLRNFVLKPMIQIAPDFIHPVFKEKIETLYNRREDTGTVDLYKKNFD